MGERGMVVLHYGSQYADQGVAIYTHSWGHRIREIVDEIVGSNVFQARMHTPGYAARIFIDQFTKDSRDIDTGYGVYPVQMAGDLGEGSFDLNYPAVHVDLTNGKVWQETWR